MPANKVRGEIQIELEGAAYVLRPSFDAIVAFEGETGRGLFDLARAADSGQLTLTEMSAIVTHCIRAQGEAKQDEMLRGVNAKKIGQLIVGAPGGMLIVMGRLNALLFGAATGGYTASGEVRAAAEKATPTAA